MSFVNTTGKVTDGAVILFNKIPFLEIEYPLPYIENDREKLRTCTTCTETIAVGLNFFETVMDIQLRDSGTKSFNESEYNELVELLKGGVIYNGG